MLKSLVIWLKSTYLCTAIESSIFIYAENINKIAEVAQLVEHYLAKVNVASSSLVFRSKKLKLKVKEKAKKSVRFTVLTFLFYVD